MFVGLARAANRSPGKGFHRAGADRVDANALRPKVIGQIAGGGLQRGLCHAHDVVEGCDTVGPLIGEGQQRAAIRHHLRCPIGDVNEGIAGNRKRVLEVITAGVDKPPRQLGLVGKGNGMHHEIERAPAILQGLKGEVHAGIVSHIHINHDVRANRLRQRFQPLAESLALVGKGQFGAGLGHRLGDPPGDRAFVGHAHDQPAFALHCDCHQPTP